MRRTVLYLVALGLSLLVCLVLLTTVTAAADVAPQHGPPLLVPWVTGQETVTVPIAFAVQALPIVLCESRWKPNAVGSAGERGLFQIHPLHRSAMATVGLDFEREADRTLWAVRLWEQSGNSFSPHWSCAK